MIDQLNAQDKHKIHEFTQKFEKTLDTLEKAKRFKIGDFLILFTWDYHGIKKQQVNSYGAPAKYKVVYTSKHGIPFIKQVNANGNPIGPLFSILGADDDNYRHHGQNFEFELDPDYADSILLEDEYDPATIHRNRKEQWKAVTAHNKACKIKTQETKDVVTFFKTVEIGHTLWTSALSHYLVQNKTTMSSGAWNAQAKETYKTGLRGNVDVFTIIDKKGKTLIVTADHFRFKALYKERPRSYKELKS